MRVRDVMTDPPVTVTPETGLKELATVLTGRGISGVPVVDGGGLVGVVSSSDVVRKEQEAEDGQQRRFRTRRAAVRTVADAMTAPPVTVAPTTSLAGAAWLMTRHDVARLPVVDRGRLVGIVTRKDLVRAFARSDTEIRREIVEEVLPSLELSPNDVLVDVVDGTVTLRGSVEEEVDARCLPHAVRAVAGVVEVDAEVAWQHTYAAPPPTPAA